MATSTDTVINYSLALSVLYTSRVAWLLLASTVTITAEHVVSAPYLNWCLRVWSESRLKVVLKNCQLQMQTPKRSVQLLHTLVSKHDTTLQCVCVGVCVEGRGEGGGDSTPRRSIFPTKVELP